jgi:hypothetical protein
MLSYVANEDDLREKASLTTEFRKSISESIEGRWEVCVFKFDYIFLNVFSTECILYFFDEKIQGISTDQKFININNIPNLYIIPPPDITLSSKGILPATNW